MINAYFTATITEILQGLTVNVTHVSQLILIFFNLLILFNQVGYVTVIQLEINKTKIASRQKFNSLWHHYYIMISIVILMNKQKKKKKKMTLSMQGEFLMTKYNGILLGIQRVHCQKSIINNSQPIYNHRNLLIFIEIRVLHIYIILGRQLNKINPLSHWGNVF